MNCNSTYTLTYQKGPIDCGPASLMMIILYYGIKTSYEEICNMCNMSSRGVSVYSLCLCAKLFGFEVAALKTETINLIKNIPLPAILYWKEKHFSVLFQANKGSSFSQITQMLNGELFLMGELMPVVQRPV